MQWVSYSTWHQDAVQISCGQREADGEAWYLRKSHVHGLCMCFFMCIAHPHGLLHVRSTRSWTFSCASYALVDFLMCDPCSCGFLHAWSAPSWISSCASRALVDFFMHNLRPHRLLLAQSMPSSIDSSESSSWILSQCTSVLVDRFFGIIFMAS